VANLALLRTEAGAVKASLSPAPFGKCGEFWPQFAKPLRPTPGREKGGKIEKKLFMEHTEGVSA
jgi:hypothetical protein